jgi:hypothetical protein
MTISKRVAALAGFLVVGFATMSPELKAGQVNNPVREGQAIVTELGPRASAITYWVTTSDGWQVVTTVDTVTNRDSASEQHAIVRFSAVLLPGQSQTVSVPLPIGEQQPVLRIQRLNDRIEVVRVPGSA